MAIDRSWDVPANPLNRFCRSDQVNYVEHDVPVAYFSTGYSEDYHQQTDEPQYADYDHMARIGNFIHHVMRRSRTGRIGRRLPGRSRGIRSVGEVGQSDDQRTST